MKIDLKKKYFLKINRFSGLFLDLKIDFSEYLKQQNRFPNRFYDLLAEYRFSYNWCHGHLIDMCLKGKPYINCLALDNRDFEHTCICYKCQTVCYSNFITHCSYIRVI